MSTVPARRPAGTPTGGQFAPTHRASSQVSLSPLELEPELAPANDHPGLHGMHEALHKMIERSDDPQTAAEAQEWKSAIERVPSTPRGTMKEWMADHDQQPVRTYQFVYDPATGAVSQPWSPGSRRVLNTRASAVLMASGDGDEPSIRDYAGCRVVGANDDVLAIESDHGERKQIAVYVAE